MEDNRAYKVANTDKFLEFLFLLCLGFERGEEASNNSYGQCEISQIKRMIEMIERISEASGVKIGILYLPKQSPWLNTVEGSLFRRFYLPGKIRSTRIYRFIFFIKFISDRNLC